MMSLVDQVLVFRVLFGMAKPLKFHNDCCISWDCFVLDDLLEPLKSFPRIITRKDYYFNGFVLFYFVCLFVCFCREGRFSKK